MITREYRKFNVFYNKITVYTSTPEIIFEAMFLTYSISRYTFSAAGNLGNNLHGVFKW